MVYYTPSLFTTTVVTTNPTCDTLRDDRSGHLSSREFDELGDGVLEDTACLHFEMNHPNAGMATCVRNMRHLDRNE